MTRTVRFSELGDPEVLWIDQEPDPTPGPGEVANRRRPRADSSATHVVATGEQDLVERVLEITDGRGREHVLDAVETLPDLWMRTDTLFAMTHDPGRPRRAGASVGAGLRDGTFAPQVEQVFDGLERVVDAHRHLASDTKIVLRPGGAA